MPTWRWPRPLREVVQAILISNIDCSKTASIGASNIDCSKIRISNLWQEFDKNSNNLEMCTFKNLAGEFTSYPAYGKWLVHFSDSRSSKVCRELCGWRRLIVDKYELVAPWIVKECRRPKPCRPGAVKGQYVYNAKHLTRSGKMEGVHLIHRCASNCSSCSLSYRLLNCAVAWMNVLKKIQQMQN